MCRTILSDTDIKAIVKHRGFSREATARAVFESFFLSDTGLKEVFASLSKREIVLLHLLKLENKAVDIAFFDALYGAEKASAYATFTQRHQPVFKTVQQNLLRNGLLVISQGYGNTKMEQWRFELPREFEALLPPLMPGSLTFDGDGEINESWLREPLSALAGGQKGKRSFYLKDGRFKFNQAFLSGREFLSWRRKQWLSAIWEEETAASSSVRKAREKPLLELLDYALGSMASAQWFKADDLTLLLKTYFHRLPHPDVHELCESGWQLGFLARHRDEGKNYYRPAPPERQIEPAAYLKPHADGTAMVDVSRVPFAALEPLAAIARFEMDGGQLKLLPDTIRLGEATDEVLQHPLTAWLNQHAKSFRQAFQTLERKRGKHCLHENLYIAKVSDLSLRVQIQTYFAKQAPERQVVMLEGDFIAFPRAHLSQIEKLVNKAGFAAKRVRR
jgi:hypothetical protein